VSLPLLTSAKKGLRGEAEDRPLMAQEDDMRDQEIRAALDRHWAASDASDFEAEHRIYREDAVLQYPQSGERIRGRRNIQITRANQPSKKRFAVRRVIGSGDLWVSEYILTYDGKPSYTVSIMEFSGDKVARETQYFARLARTMGRKDGHVTTSGRMRSCLLVTKADIAAAGHRITDPGAQQIGLHRTNILLKTRAIRLAILLRR
jgi:ketosteroid isomerase-like protein